jgi:hypothetical protein
MGTKKLSRSSARTPGTDLGSEDHQLRVFQKTLATCLALPAAGWVVDEPVTVLAVEYDGRPRRGLSARCRTGRGGEHQVALADVRFPDGSEAEREVARYRAWLDLATPTPPASSARAGAVRPGGDVDLSHPVDLVVVSVKDRAARCQLVGSDERITLRCPRLWTAVPGEIVTVRPQKRWRYAGHPYLSGEISATRVDAAALGLAPLRLEPRGTWEPSEEYWGEEREPLEEWAQDVIAQGPRPEFEMEQVLPGSDPDEPDLDPIIEANETKDAGHPARARRMLMALLEKDLRCLDAHAHLGNLAFDHWPQEALRHYEVGVRIGELSLPRFELPAVRDRRPWAPDLYSR